MQKETISPVIKEEPVFDFQQIDSYLHRHVQSKSIWSLGMLVLISIAMVYVPYESLLHAWLQHTPIIIQAWIKALVYTVPIAASFCYVFRDSMKQLFQRMTILQHMECLLLACLLLWLAYLWGHIVESLISMDISPHVMDNTSKVERMLSIPGLLVQLLGENLMFVVFFFFWYKCITCIKKENTAIVLLAMLVAGITFGMMHLTAYHFNVLQCILLVGMPAAMHLLWFVHTRNIHMAYWLHVYYDLIIIYWSFM
ncbi:hypothetical protein [Bacillus cereus]|uniref:CPBP family intramembrane metalloprotease n=1 Tax=Bacillus cereus TaxID=1396 RepID=A0AAW5L3Y3_BACCE|nr:hypothetical protein [Bacillus cereus]MCQ6288956.1 hypothetical protein [Bacillus cereus]MCQ6318359.1 hypothetical protein [Bacillus cereus]MCQ6330749.1 hypothetical protein [Bacillus cereus]MCQ6385995.1 hypothetical protein [Bacillus cereus]